jgi:hypothetical protein
VLLTSPQVLELQPTDCSKLVPTLIEVAFLDEFRMAIFPGVSPSPELVLFDTLVPQNYPGNLQRFELPPEFRDRAIFSYVDHDRHLGAPSRDEALVGDPSQAVFVMERRGVHESKILVVRTQALIGQKRPVRSDSRVPWDAWRRYVTAVKVPKEGHSYTFVHGAQVMRVQGLIPRHYDRLAPRTHYVWTFDFSRRGSLRPLEGTGKKALCEDRERSEFESEGGVSLLYGLRSLSDGSLCCLVSGSLWVPLGVESWANAMARERRGTAPRNFISGR